MANPPYSGCVIIMRENQDGISIRAFSWDEKIAAALAGSQPGQIVGMEIPPSPAGLIQSLQAGNPDRTIERQVANRTGAKSVTGIIIDAVMPETAA